LFNSFPIAGLQVALLCIAALLGRLFFSKQQSVTSPHASLHKSSINWSAFIMFGLLLVTGFFIQTGISAIELFQEFYVAGSLVFGGGHVVLPLLQDAVANSLGHSEFLIGYAAAQAVPGPMFTFATYLGAGLLEDAPLFGALIATIAIFLPGFLLIIACKPAWQNMASNPNIAAALAGVNAAVVGLLLAAFYQPVLTSAVGGWVDAILALIGFVLLRVLKVPVILLVLSYAALGVLMLQIF